MTRYVDELPKRHLTNRGGIRFLKETISPRELLHLKGAGTPRNISLVANDHMGEILSVDRGPFVKPKVSPINLELVKRKLIRCRRSSTATRNRSARSIIEGQRIGLGLGESHREEKDGNHPSYGFYALFHLLSPYVAI
jgi:hypothetical protein